MYHIFIHLSVDGYLGRFHVSAIVNNAAVNIGGTCIFSNSKFSRNGISGSYGNSIFGFLKKFQPCSL